MKGLVFVNLSMCVFTCVGVCMTCACVCVCVWACLLSYLQLNIMFVSIHNMTWETYICSDQRGQVQTLKPVLSSNHHVYYLHKLQGSKGIQDKQNRGVTKMKLENLEHVRIEPRWTEWGTCTGDTQWTNEARPAGGVGTIPTGIGVVTYNNIYL